MHQQLEDDLMYGETHLLAQRISDDYRQGRSEAVARRWALQHFRRVLWAGVVDRAWARLTGRYKAMAKLPPRLGAGARPHQGVREVALSQIVGSEGRADDFDASFRPQKSHTAERWIGIAVARQLGVALPPVTLIQVGECYFVRDGNHRVSVALAMGQATIDAEVVSAA